MIEQLIDQLVKELSEIDEESRIDVLNHIRLQLSSVSPLNNHPADCVLWVKSEEVFANDYNPNYVAPPEMKLLKKSIKDSGYALPVVLHKTESNKYELVDGYHRTKICKEDLEVSSSTRGRIPATLIRAEMENREKRIQATIEFNAARGVHAVVPMVKVVAEMIKLGLSASQVGQALGMDADEVLKYVQAKGLPELFKNHEYNRSWE